MPPYSSVCAPSGTSTTATWAHSRSGQTPSSSRGHSAVTNGPGHVAVSNPSSRSRAAHRFRRTKSSLTTRAFRLWPSMSLIPLDRSRSDEPTLSARDEREVRCVGPPADRPVRAGPMAPRPAAAAGTVTTEVGPAMDGGAGGLRDEARFHAGDRRGDRRGARRRRPADGRRPAEAVRDLAPYGAVVLGGALYMGRWHKAARRFGRRLGQTSGHARVAVPQRAARPERARRDAIGPVAWRS